MGIRGVNIPKIQKTTKKISKVTLFLNKTKYFDKKNHQYFLSSHNPQFK